MEDERIGKVAPTQEKTWKTLRLPSPAAERGAARKALPWEAFGTILKTICVPLFLPQAEGALYAESAEIVERTEGETS